jgi:Uma2 family endonuclease
METRTRGVTFEGWLRSDLPEGSRSELIDGVIEMTPLASKRHQRVLRNLIRQLDAFIASHPGVLAGWDAPCRLPIPGQPGSARGREPDLGLYDRDPPDLDDPMAWAAVLPVVAVEVVSVDPAEAYRDYVEKRRDYHAADIPEYWLVDFRLRLFTALRRTPHGWDEHTIEGGASYSTALLPGLALDTGKLWL